MTESLSCQICYDAGPQFLQFRPKDLYNLVAVSDKQRILRIYLILDPHGILLTEKTLNSKTETKWADVALIQYVSKTKGFTKKCFTCINGLKCSVLLTFLNSKIRLVDMQIWVILKRQCTISSTQVTVNLRHIYLFYDKWSALKLNCDWFERTSLPALVNGKRLSIMCPINSNVKFTDFQY